MTKYFDFNWRKPVADELIQGATFDRWSEVSIFNWQSILIHIVKFWCANKPDFSLFIYHFT